MRNELFETKKNELEVKYAERIGGIAKANNVDMGVAFDMLVSNAERGTNYVGGGEATVEEWSEIVNDVKELRATARV